VHASTHERFAAVRATACVPLLAEHRWGGRADRYRRSENAWKGSLG
jgi:hypothetical protein